MRATVVHPKELGPGDRSGWAEVLRADPALASPFLTPGFAEVVGAACDNARVATFDGGWFAFQTGEHGAGRPIGATICDAQAVVVPSGFDWDARGLVRACGLTSWSFDHAVPSQKPLVPFHRSRHLSPIIDLRSGYDAYLAAVRAQSRDVLSQSARRRRKLEREVAPLTCEWNRAEPADLTTLLAWKSDQYRRSGVWDRFAEPWIEQVVRTLAEPRDDPHLEGVLTTLHAGNRLVAAHFGLRAGSRLSWWFPAYDPELGRYSPGLVLLLDLPRLALEHGVDVVDLGRGEHHYKLRVANSSSEVAQGVVPAV
jgi:CelD/BcsL family acetyltransferase involved in cellulose biosynthesis